MVDLEPWLDQQSLSPTGLAEAGGVGPAGQMPSA